jgi:hypothetical protein
VDPEDRLIEVDRIWGLPDQLHYAVVGAQGALELRRTMSRVEPQLPGTGKMDL